MSYCVPVLLWAHPASDGLWLSWEAAPRLFSMRGRYHSPFIRFSLRGHFDHFHFWTVMHSAAENIIGFFLVFKYLRTLRSLGIVDTLDLMFLVGDSSVSAH